MSPPQTQSRPRDLAARIVAAVFIGSALAAFYELRTYRRHVIHLDRLEPAWIDLALAHLSLWARTLVWLALPTAVAVVMVFRGRRRFAVGVAFACSLSCLLWLAVDARLMRITGAHVHTYLGFALLEGGREWGGDIRSVTGPLLRVGAGAVGLLVAVWVLVLAVAPRVRLGRPRLVPLGVLYLLVPLALIGGRGLGSGPLVLERLYEVMPLRTTLNHPARVPGAGTGGFGVSADEAFEPAARLFADRMEGTAAVQFQASGDGLPAPSRTPHVVLFILESFRHDAITPSTMPRLAAWGARGLVADAHSSGSNRSDMGTYALLHGRWPMEFEQRARRAQREAPALLRLFSAAGYRTTLVASCPFTWQRMDAYFDAPPFDAQHIHVGDLSWPDRDRACVTTVRRILANADGTPQLVVVFLMSTHWSYEFPAAYGEGLEVAPPTHWNDRDRVAASAMRARYGASLRFLDDELGAFVASAASPEHLVIVTGDHGESFRDDGVSAHATKLSDAQTRTPFIAVGPGFPAVRRRHASLHLDLVPTLAHWLYPTGLEIRHADGIDLRASDARRDFLLMSPVEGVWHLALVRPERRLLMRFEAQPLVGPRLRLVGFADREAFLSPGFAQPPDRIAEWTAATQALLGEQGDADAPNPRRGADAQR
ncbi:MAG: sulfatase-like hydrolase/transferase [Planctomycetota bacterium]|nr:sulfatase-like hydrolase/transferase [Planctomycetota bacterium]